MPGRPAELPPLTGRVDIAFTAAALSMPEKVRFRFRLAGLESTWREAAAVRQASYTNLAPGDYRFEVVAINEDGVESAAPAVATLRIAPAFWQTAWFRLLSGVLAVGLLAALYRWRVGRLTARVRERLEVKMRERERIARALHDTVLQSLQGLLLRFEAVKHGLAPDSEVRARMEEGLQRAEAAIAEGRDSVRGLRHGTGPDEALDRALAAVANECAAHHPLAWSQETTGQVRPLQPAIAEEVHAIAREALRNAFQHSGGTQVTLTVRYDADALVVMVADDGTGFDPAVDPRVGREGHWGLRGMREAAGAIGAAVEIGHPAGGGTSVTLRVPAIRAYAARQENGWMERLRRLVRRQ
ncbi:histidine kinase-like protein [Pseudoduganella lurida]|uniref:Histidine kinase-like protein n=1 Tax=Pseudoduganella lurida TaxID=1036180 RepID=A0A562RLY1_9BURK|nr:triple tyrosine motif-containing protein [Pseudoduganella lurida]TWI70019.1 histidine kinase-like protein [Pseudoduganella lurida]